MKRLIFGTFFAAVALLTAAQMPVKIGVRVGVNTSSIGEIHSGADAVSGFQQTNWKPGFLAGAVVDVPMTSFLALQPGFYFDYRHSSYQTTGEFSFTPAQGEPEATMARHTRGDIYTSWFHVPVLFSFRWQAHKALQLQADFGPYISLGLGGHDRYVVTDFSGTLPTAQSAEIKVPTFGKGTAHYFRADWGFKMGIGLLIYKHYYVGAHYLAGVRNIARNKSAVSKSDTRAWQFSLGYNF